MNAILGTIELEQKRAVFDRQLTEILKADRLRWELLRHVSSLLLPDCWVGAGFVRNAVWDQRHGYKPSLLGDVDVIWFDQTEVGRDCDDQAETALRSLRPDIDWSVKNQANMHHRNGDMPYASATDAMRYWPETATALAVRLNDEGMLEVAAPYGLADLFGLRLCPTPLFFGSKRAIFDGRVKNKRWLSSYPLLTLD